MDNIGIKWKVEKVAICQRKMWYNNGWSLVFSIMINSMKKLL